MNLLGFVFVVLFSVSGHALQCQDLFSSEGRPQTAIQNLRIFETLPENFTQMNLNDRLEALDYMVVYLKKALAENPQPGWISRYISPNGIQQNREFRRLRKLYDDAKKMKDAYHVVHDLLYGEVKQHALDRGDKIQLLNRLMVDPEILVALKFLNQRQSDMHGKDRLEQYFIDSVVMYLAWGPNLKMFPVPINHWLIFDIFLGHEDVTYMAVVSHQFRDAAKMYREEKENEGVAEIAIEDYLLRSHDPVFDMIEKTQQKSPNVIERLVEQEIENGHVVYDREADALRIVDDSL